MPSRERLNQETIPGGKNSPSPGCRVISKIGLQPGGLHSKSSSHGADGRLRMSRVWEGFG